MSNYLKMDSQAGITDSFEDAITPTEDLKSKLALLEQELKTLGEGGDPVARIKLILSMGYILIELGDRDRAWGLAHEALPTAIEHEEWLNTVEACDIIYLCEKDDAVMALAHGIWLGVTFPIDPELSVAMLQHLVDETPDHSDGAALAAVTASYIADLRCEESKMREELMFFTSQLLGQVARRHSQIEDQEVFDFWMERMGLDAPEKFLPKMANVLDLLVADKWWFDRDALRALIPTE